MLSKLMNRIYCMSYSDIILGCAIFVLLMLWQRKHCGERLRLLWVILLILWSGAVWYTTIWSREAGGVYRANWFPFHSYREILSGGSREILRSNFMNILLFFPAGVLMGAIIPEHWPRRRWFVLALSLFGCFSLCIELMQFYQEIGRSEMDDILHNLLGGVLGCMVLSMGSAHERTDT